MNNHPDPLETELEAMRPADLSPAVLERVGRTLAAREGTRWTRPTLSWLALAAAACVVFVLGTRETDPPENPKLVVATAPAPATMDEDRPALATYRRALSRSPESLDDLLARHAARAPAGERQTAGLGGGL